MTPGVGGGGGRRRGPRRRCDRGQATAELALVLPFVGLLLLAVVQVAVIARDQVLVVHAAREAAREAAVDPEPGAARRAALRGAPLDAEKLRVLTTRSAAPDVTVAVEVRYEAATDVPIVGLLLPDVALRASAAMRAEW